MSLPPDQPPPSPPAKPKLTPEERRVRRRVTIRLRMAIGRVLEKRGVTTPAEIGRVLGMPPSEAVYLLNRHQWREGDVVLLEAAAARLGVQTPSS